MKKKEAADHPLSNATDSVLNTYPPTNPVPTVTPVHDDPACCQNKIQNDNSKIALALIAPLITIQDHFVDLATNSRGREKHQKLRILNRDGGR